MLVHVAPAGDIIILRMLIALVIRTKCTGIMPPGSIIIYIISNIRCPLDPGDAGDCI